MVLYAITDTIIKVATYKFQSTRYDLTWKKLKSIEVIVVLHDLPAAFDHTIISDSYFKAKVSGDWLCI